MNTEWNPSLYLKFQKERTQPSIDLVNRIEYGDPEHIIDVGCGPGNSTEVLKSRWPKAKIVGIDNSPQMIDRAKDNYPSEEWVLTDVRQFDPKEKFDIVFSNAVLQWIPDHEVLIPHLLSLLKSEGVLAIQVPQNQDSSLHKVLFETIVEKEFIEYTWKSINIFNYNTASFYYNILCDKVKDIFIWETAYHHILESHDDLISWYKSTGMRPFLESLPSDDLKNQLIAKVFEKCEALYTKQTDGRILFPFNRLFILSYL